MNAEVGRVLISKASDFELTAGEVGTCRKSADVQSDSYLLGHPSYNAAMPYRETPMQSISQTTWPALLFAALIATSTAIAQDNSPSIEQLLLEGRLADSEQAAKQAIQADADDQVARFGLGVTQFLQAIEGLAQDNFRYGLLTGRTGAIPMMRLSVPQNPDAEEISYQKARAIVEAFIGRLKAARETLHAIKPNDELRLRIRIGAVRIDVNGDGKLEESETIWRISQLAGNARQRRNVKQQDDFPIAFDAGDVRWLEGYCHLLSAAGEAVLAYDWRDQFERTAHMFYPRVKSPYAFFADEAPASPMSFEPRSILDLIAWVHTFNYELVDAKRMQHALTHLETVVKLSQESWELIKAETDDDREWLPNPNQTSTMGQLIITQDVLTGWYEFLDEVDSILQGKTLVPFWRGVRINGPVRGVPLNDKIGINARKIFTNPTRFDLVLWMQGTGLHPYLEEGKIVDRTKWNKMMRSFRGSFFSYFFWIN